jgi:hypothetical protein
MKKKLFKPPNFWLQPGSGSAALCVYVVLLIWKLSLSRTRHSYATHIFYFDY